MQKEENKSYSKLNNIGKRGYEKREEREIERERDILTDIYMYIYIYIYILKEREREIIRER